MIDVEKGDIFLAHNKDTTPPKNKFHLCINSNMYFLINTKQARYYSYCITPADCSLLKYDSYINCEQIHTAPIKGFNVIKKEQLSQNAIRGLIDKVKYTLTLTEYQKEVIISDLSGCLNING